MNIWSRLWVIGEIYITSGAGPIVLIGGILVLFLPAKSDIAQTVAFSTFSYSVGLAVTQLPQVSADIQIDKWFAVSIGYYLVLAFSYFQDGIGLKPTFWLAIIPAVIFSSIYTMWKADDDDLKH